MFQKRGRRFVVGLVLFLTCSELALASPEGSGNWQGFLRGMSHLWRRQFEDAETEFFNAIARRDVDNESFAACSAALAAVEISLGNFASAKKRLEKYSTPQPSTHLSRQYSALIAEMKRLAKGGKISQRSGRLFVGRICHMYNRWFGLRVSRSLDHGGRGPERQLRLLDLKCRKGFGVLHFQLREVTNDVIIYAYRDDGFYFCKLLKNVANPNHIFKLPLPVSGRKGKLDTYRLYVDEQHSYFSDIIDLVPMNESLFNELRPTIDGPWPMVATSYKVKLTGRIKRKTAGTITAIATLKRKVLQVTTVKPNGGFHIWIDLGDIESLPMKVDFFVETKKGVRGPCQKAVFEWEPSAANL